MVLPNQMRLLSLAVVSYDGLLREPASCVLDLHFDTDPTSEDNFRNHSELIHWSLAESRTIAYEARENHRTYMSELTRFGLQSPPSHEDANPIYPWECAQFWYSRYLAEPEDREQKTQGKPRFKRHPLPQPENDTRALDRNTTLGRALATIDLIEYLAGPRRTERENPLDPGNRLISNEPEVYGVRT